MEKKDQKECEGTLSPMQLSQVKSKTQDKHNGSSFKSTGLNSHWIANLAPIVKELSWQLFDTPCSLVKNDPFTKLNITFVQVD